MNLIDVLLVQYLNEIYMWMALCDATTSYKCNPGPSFLRVYIKIKPPTMHSDHFEGIHERNGKLWLSRGYALARTKNLKSHCWTLHMISQTNDLWVSCWIVTNKVWWEDVISGWIHFARYVCTNAKGFARKCNIKKELSIYLTLLDNAWSICSQL